MPNHFLPQLLSKNDPRFITWKNSLRKRTPPWNKGLTTKTDIRLKKMSDTFKKKGINNFILWRNNRIKKGVISMPLKILTQNTDLAILTGLILGDGHIEVYPRTERLTISLNTKYPKLIKYATYLIERVFRKKPNPCKITGVNCVRLSLYQKDISKRLYIPTGDRSKDTIGVPYWIFKQNEFIIGCLKGLFEAEGSLSIHEPTCTYNFQFSNKSPKLLEYVRESLVFLGFHPEVRCNGIRLRKKKEVALFKSLISFRKYSCGVV